MKKIREAVRILQSEKRCEGERNRRGIEASTKKGDVFYKTYSKMDSRSFSLGQTLKAEGKGK